MKIGYWILYINDVISHLYLNDKFLCEVRTSGIRKYRTFEQGRKINP
jgi:hypothetical protein